MIIRKLFKAEMAHAVPGAYTRRCHYLHGHSYRFELFLKSKKPNSAQMVADFKGVKDTGVSDFLDSLDHAVMLWEKDPLASDIARINPQRHLIVPFIPTAEMLAKAIHGVCSAILETQQMTLGEGEIHVDRVVVHETESGFASYGQSDVEGDLFPGIQFERWTISNGIQADWTKKDWYAKSIARLRQQAKP